MKKFEYQTIIVEPKGITGGKVDSNEFNQTLNKNKFVQVCMKEYLKQNV